eukprot:g78331.t1
MGNLIAKLMAAWGDKECRILMIGLDAAGKTTVVYKLRLGETVTTMPTIGFNVEEVKYKNLNFVMWDIGGQHKIRALWKHYYQGTDGIIFVVDSNDKLRLEEAREELHLVLSDSLLNSVPLLVLANKQDLPKAAKVQDMAKELSLPQIRGRHWHIQGTSAPTGDGLYEGLDWLHKVIVGK